MYNPLLITTLIITLGTRLSPAQQKVLLGPSRSTFPIKDNHYSNLYPHVPIMLVFELLKIRNHAELASGSRTHMLHATTKDPTC